MFIKVDWFKSTGKWYGSGVINITDGILLHDAEFKQEIVNNQQILLDGWQENDYYVVTRETPGDEMSPNFHGFFAHLFMPDAFKGMKRL